MDDAPGLCAVFALATGIALGRPESSDPFLHIILAAGVVLALFTASPRLKILLALSAAAGAILIYSHDHRAVSPDDVSRMTSDRRIDITAEYSALQSRRERTDKILLAVKSVNGQKASGYVTANVRRHVIPDNTLPGDTLAFTGVELKPIRGFRNIGSWDYAKYLNDNGISAILRVYSRTKTKVVESRWTPRRPLEKFKRRFLDMTANLDGGVASIMDAMILGDQGRVSPKLRDSFSRAGTAHLLAVSGLHVGFMAGAAFFLIKGIVFLIVYGTSYNWAAAGVPMRVAAVAAIAVVWAYCLLTGPRLPAFRAGIMATTYLVAVALGRGRDFYGAFAAAMAIILVAMPWSLFYAGFQLSFSAVFFLAVFLERFWKPVHGQSHDPADVAPSGWARLYSMFPFAGSWAAASLFAFLGAGPIAALHFNVIPLYGVALNILLIPLASIAVPLGMAGLLLSSPGLLGFASHAFSLITGLTEWTANTPMAYLHIPDTEPTATLFFFLAALLTLVPSGTRYKRAILGAALAGLAVSLVAPPLADSLKRETTVRFLDVGQGDSTLVTWPGGGALLIDSGASFTSFDIGRSIVAPAVWRAQRASLSAFILTHGDFDHIGGALGLMDRIPAAIVFDHGNKSGHERLNSIRSVAIFDGVYRPLIAGDRLEFTRGLSVEVMNPPKGKPPFPLTENNMSLVMKVVFGDSRFLLAGDIEKEVEEVLLKSGADLSADVLKVAHHGSGSSTTSGFLRAVRPKYAVISAGYKNSYGHPNPRTLKRLEQSGARIFRTDIDGEIAMTTNGRNIEIDTWADLNGR